MPNDLQSWSRQVHRLHHALEALLPAAEAVGVTRPTKDEWYELLTHKLLPQVDAEPLLVVAVVGGTNIGKSVVFNHLAGENASAVSPLAAGTKHPVCLTPPGFDDGPALIQLFPGFELDRWQSAENALQDTPQHRLFWRVGENVPPRLLLLDTPDIDSDAQVNWQRADHIRQSADLLVAVLTQQKYNDAAVKQFFRKAADAEKQVIVVFNQCDLEDDRDFWPQWLETFCEQTGVDPALVYVVPYDRKAANDLRLMFYELGSDGKRPVGAASSLREELALLHFDSIKIRTFRGALSGVLDPQRGAPAYLYQIRRAGAEFESAAKVIGTMKTAAVQWPTLPAQALVEEIRAWWDLHRTPWSRKVHDVYRTIGNGMTWPIRTAWEKLRPPTVDRLDAFHGDERQAIVRAVENLLVELERLAEVGNDTLRPRLAALLTGDARGELLHRVQQAHQALPALDDDYRQFLRAELDRWGKENPRAVTVLRSADQVLAIARPAITVSLAVGGWFVAGGIVHDAVAQAATHTVSQLATEAVITGGITGGGEVLVSTTGEGVKQAAARLFGRLQTRYAELRANWLAEWLERELLGGVLGELCRGAVLPQSPVYRDVEVALEELSADR